MKWTVALWLLVTVLYVEAQDDVPAPATPDPATPDPATPDPATPGPGADSTGKPNLFDQLWEQLNDMFGGSTNEELFTLEFPARVLDEVDYFYNVTSSSSKFLKPQAVKEAEAVLVDQVLGPYQIANAPTAKLLSEQYVAALNSVVPKPVDTDFRKDQELIRKWLLSPVTVPSDSVGWVVDGPAGSQITRAVHKSTRVDKNDADTGIHHGHSLKANAEDDSDSTSASMVDTTLMIVHQALYHRYLAVKLAWDLNKTMSMSNIMDEDLEAQDRLFRYLAVASLDNETMIESHWEELVVRGYHHRVVEAMGYLDITTAAEMIEDARAAMRQVAESRIEGGSEIYPVSLEPSNWASSLSTAFTPEDLLMDPQYEMDRIFQLQTDITSISSQITLLQSLKEGDTEKLKQDRDAAEKQVAAAQSSLINSYGQNIVTAVDIFLKAKYGADGPPADKVDDEDSAQIKKLMGRGDAEKPGKAPISPEDVQHIYDGFKQVQQAQTKMTAAIQRLSQVNAALALSKTTNFKVAIATLHSMLSDKQNTLSFIKAQFDRSKVRHEFDAGTGNFTKANLSNASVLPSTSNPGPWTQVIFHGTESTRSSETSKSASASSKSWGVDLFFGSGGGSSSKSSSNAVASLKQSDVDIEMGFEATKVTIDRSSWFHLGLLTNTASFSKIRPDTVISSFLGDDNTGGQTYKNDILPSYTTSFIVARDVTIKLKSSKIDSKSANEFRSSQSASSGGCFCFSYSRSSSSSSSSQSSFMASQEDLIVIRIPGPQIIGWTQKFVPKDESSSTYQRLPADYFPKIPERI